MKKLALIICLLLLISMVACTNEPEKIEDETEEIANDVQEDASDGAIDGTNNGTNSTAEGALTGVAQGYGGEVFVTVVVDVDDIISVYAEGPDETEGIGTKAMEELPKLIEEADSTEVDVIAGATVTSNAIKQAVDNALDQND